MSVLERCLPVNPDAERFVLGAVLLNDQVFPSVAGVLDAKDFGLEKHRLMFQRISEMHSQGDRIDRVTLTNELQRRGQLESVDGPAYVASLDEGMPHLSNLDAYARVVKDSSIIRQIAHKARNLFEYCAGGHDAQTCLRHVENLSRELSAGIRAERNSEPLEVQSVIHADFGKLMNPKAGGGVRLQMPWLGLPEMAGGQLIVIGARTSIGKSAFVTQLARCSAAGGTKTILYSLEMERLSVIRRMVAGIVAIDVEKWERDALDNSESMQANRGLAFVDRLPLLISDKPHQTVASIRSKLVKMQSAGESAGLVVVDYLQLLSPMGRTESRNVAIGEVCRGLKELAMEFNIPIVAPSQLARVQEREKREPWLGDLRESGDIEHSADIVIFLHPTDPDRFFEEKNSRLHVLVRKNRQGRTGSRKLLFEKPYCRFVDESL